MSAGGTLIAHIRSAKRAQTGTHVYILRDDAATQTLRLELTGEVTSAEAARAISQAFALGEASKRSRVVCDLTGVRRGPEEIDAVAALFKGRTVSFRLAFVGHAGQLLVAVRLAELAGITLLTGAFSNTRDADAWLDRPANEGAIALPETALRHLQPHRNEAMLRRGAAKRAEPAA